MATVYFVGNAPLIAQVITLTLGGTWEVGDIIKFAFGNKTYSYPVTSTTISVITAALEAALQALSASDYPEFGEMTFDSTATTVTLTSNTKGREIPVVVTTTESNGDAADSQTLSQSTTTANSGPSDWNCAMNWSGGAVPVSTDDIILDGAICNASLLYGLDQNGIQLASLKAINGWSGALGLPERNEDATAYDEYRTTELKADITAIDIASASGRIKINGQAVQTAITVRSMGASLDALPAFQWRGTHADNTLTVLSGTVGVALKASETATVNTLRQSGGEITCSSGVGTFTSILKAAGTLTIESATTALVNDSGDVTINGSGAHAAITNNGGTINYNSSGTITAYTGNRQSVITFDGRNVARTMTNGTFNDEASLIDTNATVTHSNRPQFFGENVIPRYQRKRQYNIEAA